MNAGAQIIHEARQIWINELSTKSTYDGFKDILFCMLYTKTNKWTFSLQMSDLVNAVNQCELGKLAGILKLKLFLFTTLGINLYFFVLK